MSYDHPSLTGFGPRPQPTPSVTPADVQADPARVTLCTLSLHSPQPSDAREFSFPWAVTDSKQEQAA